MILLHCMYSENVGAHKYRSLNLQNNLLFTVKCLKFSQEERRACIYIHIYTYRIYTDIFVASRAIESFKLQLT